MKLFANSSIATAFLSITFNFQVIANEYPAPKHTAKQAEHALIQGETQLAKQLLAETSQNSEAILRLEILLTLAQGDTDQAEVKLKKYEQVFADNPQTFAFSSEVWRSIGHQVSIFSKRSRYRNAVAAKIKAGKIAPQNAMYLTLQASALGQSSDYGGDEDKQQQVTDKIVALDKKWGIIAQINLTQNTDNEEQGKLLTQQALQMFPNDFYILERVAQYYWTGKQYENAQRFFYQACKHNPDAEYHTQVKWFNSCYLTAQFTKDKGLSVKYGIEALEILLREYSLITEENFEVAELLYDIDEAKSSRSWKHFFEQTVTQANDKQLVKKAKSYLKTY